jgi:hypothetical protein
MTDGMNVVTTGWNRSATEHGEVVSAVAARAAEYVRMSTEHQKNSTETRAKQSSNMQPDADW